MARNYSNYNPEIFADLLKAQDWDVYNLMDDPEEMWNVLYSRIYDILSVMCPFKNYKQREKITPRP